MFRSPSTGPQPTWKRPIYLLATVVLGALLALLAQLVLVWVDRDNYFSAWRLTGWPGLTWLILGAVGGFFLGRFWWRWVYIERRWDAKPPSR